MIVLHTRAQSQRLAMPYVRRVGRQAEPAGGTTAAQRRAARPVRKCRAALRDHGRRSVWVCGCVWVWVRVGVGVGACVCACVWVRVRVGACVCACACASYNITYNPKVPLRSNGIKLASQPDGVKASAGREVGTSIPMAIERS